MSPEHLDTCHKLALTELEQVQAHNDNVDAEGILHLVVAAIELEKKNFEASLRSLDWIRENEKEFVTETWVFPFSLFYRALYHLLLTSNLHDGIPLALDELRKSGKCSDFCFEFRLAFRSHLVTIQLEEWLKDKTACKANVLTRPTKDEIKRLAQLNW